MAQIPIALLTDYGWSDAYVGTMRAVILGINPEAVIFDISHDVSPQSVEEGAFLLAQATPYLPPNSICVAVVDPGVGTRRRAIAVRRGGQTFIGPDNGLLSVVLDDRERAGASLASDTDLVEMGAGLQGVELLNTAYFRHPVSKTFHGRDIFAPVAAHLSVGVPVAALGPAIASINAFPPWRARQAAGDVLSGRVLHVDHFGNLITSVRVEDLPSRRIEVEVADHRFEGLQNTFQDGPEYVVYIGSSGLLEIARRNASASAALGVTAGGSVRVSVLG